MLASVFIYQYIVKLETALNVYLCIYKLLEHSAEMVIGTVSIRSDTVFEILSVMDLVA